ncbi:glycosyltransferase family 2 protein [bacterium]|nr:glycosyltransferase family 2 protein [bacterium]
MPHTKLDIVIPVFNEIEIIEQLHERVVTACRQTGESFQVIYIDDGSSDGTAHWIATNATAIDLGPQGRTKLIRLSRNFGQPAAIHAGLKASHAECVVLMDGDLQDPPELIPEMLERWMKGDQIVIAQRTSRKESLIRGIGFKIFHKIFRYLSDSKMPANTGTFCLLDRQAVEAVCRMSESHRFFPGLRAWVGFRQSFIPLERPPRAGGSPKQTLGRLTQYALDAIFGYSLKPLRVLTAIGTTICGFALMAIGYFVLIELGGWETSSFGLKTLSCAILALGGFQVIAIGVLGEYVGRIYDEVRRRPAYIVAQELEIASKICEPINYHNRKAS